jgi:hypothetical protein
MQEIAAGKPLPLLLKVRLVEIGGQIFIKTLI